LNILLVYPPYELELSAPPLGLAYLASVLERNGYSPVIKDFRVEIGFEDIESTLKEYDIVGISFMTPMVNAAEIISKAAKRAGCTVIVGGPHATALPEEMLEKLCADFVVLGEGELTFLQLIQALEKDKSVDDIKGLVFKENDNVIKTGETEFIQDIDSIPFPARHLLQLKKYSITYPGFNQRKPITSMITSRGCPAKCIFCSSHILFGRKPRLASPDYVVNEMKSIINDYGINQINISDDTFTLNKQRVISICEKIISEKLDVIWACSTRANTLSTEMLEHMKAAGCTRIGLGIESASPAILKNIKKGVTIEQVEKAIEMINVTGLQIVGYFMVGNLGESNETVSATADFVGNHKDITYGFSYATPFPGTEFFNLAREKNYVRTKNWAEYVITNGPVARTEELSLNQLEQAHNKLIKSSRDSLAKRIIKIMRHPRLLAEGLIRRFKHFKGE